MPFENDGYGLQALPTRLFDTGTPKALLKRKNIAVIENKKVQTEMPEWIQPWDEKTRKDSERNAQRALARIPFTTEKTRYVIAIPSIGVVAPVVMAPEDAADYKTLISG